MSETLTFSSSYPISYADSDPFNVLAFNGSSNQTLTLPTLPYAPFQRSVINISTAGAQLTIQTTGGTTTINGKYSSVVLWPFFGVTIVGTQAGWAVVGPPGPWFSYP